MGVFRHTPQGRPSAALFGTRPPVPRATFAAWARRLAAERAWAHPMLLHTDAARLLRQMEQPGVLLGSAERQAWDTLARDIGNDAGARVHTELRAVFSGRDTGQATA